MAEPERIEYTAGGLHFGALAWGDEGGPLAICLHGFPDSAWTWRFLGPRLAADGRRVVAPFMRGYAPTDVPADRDYSIAALGRDVLAARDALGGGEDTVLVGHDWGAVAAYAVAARFTRVVTLAWPPGPWLFSLRGRQAARQARLSWYMAFAQLRGIAERALPRLVPRLWADWSPGYDAAEDVARFLAAIDGPGRRRAVLGPYRALADPRNRAWRAVPVPRGAWLHLHGRDDGCSFVAAAERGRDLVPPNAIVELVDGAGHFPQLERPELVGEAVAAFLAG